jgi:dephospho-CoA kinase
MVFLSTLQTLLGSPLTRSVFAFGYRKLTQRIIVEEIVMGLFMVFPLSIILAQWTIRFAAAGWRPSVVRSDVWTTILITVVGDIFLEILLPSLQCLPMHEADHHRMMMDSSSIPSLMDSNNANNNNNNLNGGEQQQHQHFMLWMAQTWGFHCPRSLQREQLLAPDSVGTILTIRLIFMCLGVYLGESFLPVALTGSIATGKSTVAAMLLDPKGSVPQHPHASKGSRQPQQQQQQQPKKKPKSAAIQQQQQQIQQQQQQSVAASSQAAALAALEPDEEGSFLIVDTDSIGHEILLPPAVLAGEQQDHNMSTPSSPTASSTGGGGGGDETKKEYTVHPNDSVFDAILSAFGDPDVGNKNILDDNGWIDRRKLGAIIFEDASQRRVLNGITHPRIILIMLKRILHGIFWSSQDIVCADVPLLFESGQLRRLFGITIMVACHPEQQLERLRQRNPDLTEQQCRDRIASQKSIEAKVAQADVVIWNTGDLHSLAEEVERVRRDVMGRMYGVGMSLLQMLLLVGGSLSLAVSSKLFSTWT